VKTSGPHHLDRAVAKTVRRSTTFVGSGKTANAFPHRLSPTSGGGARHAQPETARTESSIAWHSDTSCA